MRGFLLGLSSSAVCLSACAPVLVPFLLGEARAVKADFLALGAFLSGRLVGYLAFAILAWSVGALLHPEPATFARLIAIAYVLLGALMVLYGALRPKVWCASSAARWIGRWGPSAKAMTWPPLMPAILGLLTGLNLCPPFLLAFTEAASARNIYGSLLFFFSFFLGTSLLFVPFPILGVLRKYPAMQIVGRLTAVVVGIIYCSIGAGMLR